MFIKLHGAVGNKLIVNIHAIKAIQEVTQESKYAEYLKHGAKTLIQIDDKLVPVKESIVQIENIFKKLGEIGGTS